MSEELENLAAGISKQSVEGAAWILLAADSTMCEKRAELREEVLCEKEPGLDNLGNYQHHGDNFLFDFSFLRRPQKCYLRSASLLSWDVVQASHVKSESVRVSPDGQVSTLHIGIPKEQAGIHEVS